MKEVWIPGINLYTCRFWQFYPFVFSTCNDHFGKLYIQYQTLERMFCIQTPRSGLKQTWLHLVFQPTSWCLNILTDNVSLGKYCLLSINFNCCTQI